MRSIASAMRDLDTALARAVQLEVDAKHWRIRSGQWRTKYENAAAEVDDLKKQLAFCQNLNLELMQMVDSVREQVSQ
jgi:hypothetical protein